MIDIVLAQLERAASRKRADGRVAFEQYGAALILDSDLTDADEQAARRRLINLTAEIPVVLVTNADRDKAVLVCRQAAARLTGAAWYSRVVDTWPAPIAHELTALVRYLQGDGETPPSPEAALLQLRDLSETMVKLPASIMARRLITRGGADADAMRLALSKVTGGAWVKLARDASALLSRAEPGGALSRIAALFDTDSAWASLVSRLVTARNDTIGHGALRPNPAETARLIAWFTAGQPGDEQPSGLKGPIPAGTTIAQGFEHADHTRPWQGLHLLAEADDGALPLTGAESLQRWHADGRHRDHAGRVLPVSLAIDGAAALTLAPLVSARICTECAHRDVFFFDTLYDRKRRLFDMLDYGRGHKSRIGPEAASDLLEELRPDPPAPGESTGGSLNSRAAIASLEAMRVDRRYLSPKYLRDGLASFLKAHDRGLYWLQAPAHVGKTMFVMGLTKPELGDSDIVPGLGPSGGIAVFFCKREYREGLPEFVQGLEESLKAALDLRGQKWFPGREGLLAAADKRRAFVAWLQEWRALAGGRHLLLVVDGLDETDPPGPNSLLSLLPRPDDLPEGLFVLLTSRPVGDPDAPSWLGPALAPVTTGANAFSRVVGLEDAPYRALMAAYARERLGAGEPEPSVQAMIAQAGGRFVFLSFLVEQRRMGVAAPKPLSGADLYGSFMDGLESRYGAKRAEDLLAILAALTAAELAHRWTFSEAGAVRDEATGATLEPLPREFQGLELETLAVVADMDEQGPSGRELSLAFVEALLLLQGVLWVWRGEGGLPRYRIGLKEFADMLGARQPDALARARARMAGACLDAVAVLAPARAADQEPEAADETTLRELVPLLPALVRQLGSEPLTWRYRDAPVGDVALWTEARHGAAKTASVAQVRWYDALLANYAMGCGPQDGTDQRQNDRAAAYMNRGVTKQSAPGFGPGAAIADYDAAIGLGEALRDALGEDWPTPWRNDLANAYGNRGNAKVFGPGFGPGAAIADYDAAIALMEALRDALGERWPPPWRNDLANAYMNRGNAKQSAPGFGPGAAIADYDAAIALREALRDALGEGWPTPWRNELANAYLNRGVAKRSAPGFGPGAAIADYDAAIALMAQLRDALGEGWPTPWRNELANAYMNRGNAKQSAPGFGPGAAIADYDAAIALREALRDALGEGWPTPWRNELAAAYMNRGIAKRSVPGFGPGAAIADYDAAIALMEALRDALGEGWPTPWRNDLANAYMNRGVAKRSAPGFGPGAAIADYDAAIALMAELRDALGEGWPTPWRNDLANVYVNRGVAKRSAPGFGPAAAIADYDAAIALREALRDALGEGWPTPWRNNLANAYMNRGNAKQDSPGFGPGPAIADYDAATALMEALRDGMGEGWPPPWRNDLANAYMNRGVAKQSAPGFGPGAAIADYDAAISLMAALRDALGEGWPPPWRNDLANAYMNRGNAKQSAPGFGPKAAIADCDAAMEIWAALKADLGEQFPPDWDNWFQRVREWRAELGEA